MTFQSGVLSAAVLVVALGLSGCGRNQNPTAAQTAPDSDRPAASSSYDPDNTNKNSSTVWDLFANADDPNTTIEVNKYLWNASLEVLNFLPVETVDPFSGIIVTGFGTPPGGGQAYRATVYVQDPALDARALKVALATRNGPVSAATSRAVEDAILTRARQLRIRDGNL
ncbi:MULTISPECIES: DUF3576 domain-containing protein [Actibacterium]|jgi:hypothetical protein|uniref:DUF3576 domain-containing protein n=1 Tax=Actibacterium naphthalenivorans TaxID=1614693 RepID=A0A840C794_9RHOB|nr:MULTISPECIES: DUF3576 domain-containing protein [Actibacterium]ALG91575.1 hypothetical protein TQ29_16980 [Actibacterium sp. EMB200-NS6]MBB4021804.1 hypothetical protein [Actibacterium naphthalenivorans]